MDPQQTVQPASPAGSQPSTIPPPNPRLPLLLGGLFVSLLILGGSYYLFIVKKTLQPQPIPQSIPTAVPTVDLTINWKDFTNKDYALKYPQNWYIEENVNYIGPTVPNYTFLYKEKVEFMPGISIFVVPHTTPEEWVGVDILKSGLKNQISVGNVRGIEVLNIPGVDDQEWVFLDREDKTVILYVSGATEEFAVFKKILSTFTFLDKQLTISITQTNIVQTNGADLTEIKYTLPQGWETKLNNNNLFISPINGGGFLSIKVYDYPSNIGRREYYCQVSRVCIEGTTYFTEMNIGNISGYMANALDNSGGGSEYFGAKGNKFYVISSYNPPSPNEFEKNYKTVLNSLIF